ncbi:sterol O-acyltransferase [Malassezia brasiliensis]|uniref:O-acyltransferase n=1 Tax=Malassezia brasiliensis TaxID=1821822 RepID=A0AAF0DX80_9BASI|nr:sterol O-acyltransferase [Malassezia brasiliensis]
MALFVLNLFLQSWRTTGELFSTTFATLMSRDAMILALSDAVLVGSTFVTVPFVKILHKYRWRFQGCLVALLWLMHCVLIATVVTWTRVREWPWVQSGFFVMHSFVMIMKVHSYMMLNGIMSDTYNSMEALQKKLTQRLAEFYNTDINEAWARAVRDTNLCSTPSTLASFEENPQDDPFEVWASRSMQTGSSMERAHQWLPRLRNQIPRARSPMPEHQRLVSALNSEKLSDHPKKSDIGCPDHDVHDPHPFMWHPDPTTKRLATEIAQLRELLYNTLDDQGLGPMWPYNVSVANFWDFQLVPSLVYHLQYPRTERVRPEYVLERVFATFGTFFVLYVITVNMIMPVTVDDNNDFLSYLLIFYLMFECICNGFAELTRFADREFYQDWWNSASMDEFSRKWNRPVHHFLLQHVYVTLIFSWGVSKRHAALVTFFFSSVLHEIVMIIVSGKVRGYLFMAQMSQYPLILLAQTKFIKTHRSLGNLLFWVGLMIGFPLLNIAYLVY